MRRLTVMVALHVSSRIYSPARLPHNLTLNFLGRPEVGGMWSIQHFGSHLQTSTESHRKSS